MGRLLFYTYTSEEVKAADHASSFGLGLACRLLAGSVLICANDLDFLDILVIQDIAGSVTYALSMLI